MSRQGVNGSAFIHVILLIVGAESDEDSVAIGRSIARRLSLIAVATYRSVSVGGVVVGAASGFTRDAEKCRNHRASDLAKSERLEREPVHSRCFPPPCYATATC